MKKFIGTLLIAFGFLITSKAQQQVFTIVTNNSEPVQYCASPVYVADKLTINGSPNINGIKVFFSEGYQNNIDTLFYSGSNISITATWVAFQGLLLLKGTASTTVEEYAEAIRAVKFNNISQSPKNGKRVITVSLDDLDYLYATNHFYQYINKPGTSWSDAKKEAETLTYYGLQGYMATITSLVESEFVKLKTKSIGWIGASDAAIEGEWRWVTGPEGLMDSGKGLLFWRGSGYLAKSNAAPAGFYGPVNGAFHNWNRWDQPFSPSLAQTTWEPNDIGNGVGTENYAHITLFPNNANESYKWNDLPNNGGNGEYVPQGFLIEYGGMPGDPEVKLTASTEIHVNTVWFDSKKEFTICNGDAITLNRKDTTANYSWSPVGNLSNPTISNPIASPKNTIIYHLIGTNGVCSGSTDFKVNVNPLPISLLNDEENICKGTSATLDPGQHTGYTWNTSEKTRTITVSQAGKYKVQLTSDKGCTSKDSVNIFVHDYPKLDLSKLDTLICGFKSTTLPISANKGNILVSSTNPQVTINNKQVAVQTFGTFPFKIISTDQFGCSKDTLITLGFHKNPTVNLSVDSLTCYGYNLDAKYIGDANIATSRFTWVFGGDTIKNSIGTDQLTIPLGTNKTDRDLILKVTQQGCSNSTILRDIKVIPDLNLIVKESLGCQPFTAKFMATNTENVAKYDWTWGDGKQSQSTIGTISHEYLNEGFYDIKLSVTTDKGCINWVKLDSIVYTAPIPTVGFTLSPNDCLNIGENRVMYVGSADVKDKYLWDLSAFDAGEIIANPGNTKGPFVFDLKNKPQASIGLQVVSKYGCNSILSSLKVKRKPVFDFTATDLQGCKPLLTSFIAKAGDPVDQLNFSWDFGDNNATSTGTSTKHLFETPDQKYNISVRAISSRTGCENIVVKNSFVSVFPNPIANFSMDHDVVYNDAPIVNFTNESFGATNYSWDFGDGDSSSDKNPEHRFLAVGRQNVLLSVFNDFLCSDTISHEVLVAFSKIFPPNAFSPNAPNIADREYKIGSSGVKAEGYHLRIISRWNDLVFEAKDQIIGWDGKLKNGQFAPPGNYVWVLEYVDFLDRKHKQTGTVTLIF